MHVLEDTRNECQNNGTVICQELPGGLNETSIDVECHNRLRCSARGTAEGMSQPSREVLFGITNGFVLYCYQHQQRSARRLTELGQPAARLNSPAN